MSYRVGVSKTSVPCHGGPRDGEVLEVELIPRDDLRNREGLAPPPLPGYRTAGVVDYTRGPDMRFSYVWEAMPREAVSRLLRARDGRS